MLGKVCGAWEGLWCLVRFVVLGKVKWFVLLGKVCGAW